MDRSEQQDYVTMLNNVILKTNNNEIKTTTEVIDMLINQLKTTHLNPQRSGNGLSKKLPCDIYNVGNL